MCTLTTGILMMDEDRQELVRELFAYLTSLAEDATTPAGDGMAHGMTSERAGALAESVSAYASDMKAVAATIEVIARRGI